MSSGPAAGPDAAARTASHGAPESAESALGRVGTDSGAVLVYDGECPVCSAYVRYVRIRESVGEVVLVDARHGGEGGETDPKKAALGKYWLERIRAASLDLNEGMVLIYGGRLYHGADCVHMLALLSSASGPFNRFNALLFKSPAAARVLYPVMRSGRNLLLRLLGRKRIES